ncbi:ATP-binding protein [Acinetobacter sp. WCHAc060025]|uniref:sensor histidine kinase n=1 Tax=Acinetobacter sp. WCHAc060025 TaxID=2518625 RepID=UPI00102349A5|nr:histidine kinase [Acinetobacter sp. WCHAc060025]
MQQSQSNRYSTSTWITRLRFHCIVFFYILFGLMQTTFAETRLEIDPKNGNNNCIAQILSTQVAKAGDDLAIVPKTGWVDVKLPDNWEQRWDQYSGSAWYKIIWQTNCPENIKNHPFAVLVDRINLAGIVYFNNELIWRDKSLVEPLSRSWNMPRYWIISSSTIKPGPNEILIRVVGLHSQNSGLGTIQIADVEQIGVAHKKLIFERRTLFFINCIITAVLGCTAFLIWFFRRKEVAYGWFALNCLCWTLFICNMLITAPFPFMDSLMHARVNLLFLLGYTYTFCLFLWRFSNSSFNFLERMLKTIAICLGLFLLFIPDNNLKPILNLVFIYCVVVFLLNCIFMQWIAFKKRKKDIYLLAIVIFSFIIIICHDLFIVKGTQLLLWTPFGAPITSLTISFILAWRIARNMRHIEKFNQTLEETVETVTFDLEQSLAKKHHLQLENMRLQERLNLSHELHDGLGGSIVRSMILLDHAENVEKNQVMSMFKLLRSDLRQVIDSGSSIGAKTPESPVMWVAPLRHRFVQIFEEMEIESTWIFSNHWNIKPPPLYCLTLSRVTEEALTNIVKHSDATDVEVSLFENDQNELILEIKDNGHGFEVNAVEKGLHVGLQSMQVRIKRLGGELEIISQSGLTVIRAILPMKE